MDIELSTDEIRICEVMGVSQQAYIESRNHERSMETSLNREATEDLAGKIASMMGMSPEEARKVKEQAATEAAARAALSPEELDICERLGVQPLEYWAQKMADAGLKPQLS